MTTACTLFVDGDTWRLAWVRDGQFLRDAVAAVVGVDVAARAAELERLLQAAHDDGRTITLALASPLCLSACVSTEGLARAGRRRALGFKLEEHLPVSVEDIVVDFVEDGTGEALGVCSELAPLRDMIAALDAVGIAIARICPAAFLAAQFAVTEHPQAHGVLIRGSSSGAAPDAAGGCDLIELHKGKPRRWCWLPDTGEDSAAVPEQLSAWIHAHEEPVQLVVIGGGRAEKAIGALSASFSTIALSVAGSVEAVALQAARISADSASPWIDLRRDQLAPPDPLSTYRRPLWALTAAAVALMITATGVSQWRARKYDALTRDYARQQVEVFKSALPQQRVPGNVRSRLLSEQQKLAALSGQGADENSNVRLSGPAALAQLAVVLAGLPAEARYQITDLSLEPDLIRVDGRVLSHADAERVSAGLRASDFYEVDPPKTQALKDGSVSFLFTAKPRTSPKAEGSEP